MPPSTEKRKRRRRRDSTSRQSGAGYVLLSEFSGIDVALKALRLSTQTEMQDARQRQRFIPKPTHSARKRRGILLEKRRQTIQDQAAPK